MKVKAKRKPLIGHPESSAANVPEPVLRDLDSRLARIEGHVAAIRRMMAAGEDCDSLLVQASAVRSALNGVLVSLMEAHLQTCVASCAKSGNAQEAVERFRAALATVLRRG